MIIAKLSSSWQVQLNLAEVALLSLFPPAWAAQPKQYGLRNLNSMGCATKTVWAVQPKRYGLRNRKSIKFDFFCSQADAAGEAA